MCISTVSLRARVSRQTSCYSKRLQSPPIFHMHLTIVHMCNCLWTSLGKVRASAASLFWAERVRFPSVIQSYWVGSAIAPNLRQKITAQEASTGHWKGQYPWPFGRDPNSWRREWPTDRERLGYVCNPRSLKEGTETSRPVATAPVPPLSGRIPARLLSENLNMRCTCCLFMLTLWSAAAGCNNRMPMCIGSFSLHSKWIGLSKRDPNSSVLRRDVSVPSFRERGLHT